MQSRWLDAVRAAITASGLLLWSGLVATLDAVTLAAFFVLSAGPSPTTTC